MEIICTHNNADFDAVAAMLAAHKLYPEAVPVLPERLNRNVSEFVTLYQNGLPFVRWEDVRQPTIESLILVDTQRMPAIDELTDDTPVLIIDHHPLEHELAPNVTYNGMKVGAVTTLLVEEIRARHIDIDSLEATLLMLGIYSDTGSLTYGTTTPRDLQAAAWLLEQRAVIDTVQRYLVSALTESQRELFDRLLAAADTRNIHGHMVMVCAVDADQYIEQINSVAHRLRDALDPDALFVLVHMPESTQLVARSRRDAIDVGEIARRFGGGGHTRAAAAKMEHIELDEAVNLLWQKLDEAVQPVARVADLMSFGVQTVEADERLADILPRLRRIGHEGYPVLDDGRVVGLLTRRDADRAAEHGLKDVSVRDVMISGEVTLSPEDSVGRLEQAMVASSWGQIPVVDAGRLIGVVTRTDLIKHWAAAHPPAVRPEERVESERIAAVLGKPVAALLNAIAENARLRHLSLYMVGGVVRDLLLGRPNLDIDFVVEADAIDFATGLREMYGGEISSYRPFGTAKWLLDDTVTTALGLPAGSLPENIDFATSRNEFYLHPTALPSVYSSSIKLDLHRRDFTINTLAIQLSPATAAERLLDFYGGLSDLRRGLIRVLHSLSFVDDPTRVLRAVRFEQRLGFQIEARTAELIESSRPMLRRITGERVRNELKLLLKEMQPERALLVMQSRNILPAIHPWLTFDEAAAGAFREARRTQDRWPVAVEKVERLYWHLMMAHIQPERLPDLCSRLLFAQSITQSFIGAATLAQQPGVLAEPDAHPSDIVRLLDGITEIALLTTWIIVDDERQMRIQRYLHEWRYLEPHTNGYTLRAMGLPPGPRYRVILDRLREACLNGEIASKASEQALLHQLIEETAHLDND
ncbi:MAG: CBS domain-containing protein [Phototrophicaceae bacterium]